MKRSRSLLAVVLATAVASLLGACTGEDGGEPDAEPSSASPGIDVGPPLEVGARRWGTRETGLTQVTGFEHRGDRIVLSGYGEYAQDDNHVLGVDTATGRERWRRTVLEPVPGADGAVLWDDGFAVGDRPDSPVAVTMYEQRAGGGYALRVGLLDPDTGRLLLASDAVARGGRGSDPYLTVVDASSDVAVVNASNVGLGAASRARTMGVDLDTGEVLWQRSGLVAAAVVGDAVLVSTGVQLDEAVPGTWSALDTHDGSTTWTRESPTESLTGLAEGLAVFFEPEAEPGLPDGVVVDLATGDDLLEVPSDAAATDVGNGFGSERSPGSLVAWLDDDDHLVTYAAGEEAPTTSPEPVPTPLFSVVGDHVTLAGDGADAVEQQGVVDRLGDPVDTGDDGGVLFYADDDLVVTGDYQTSFAVLRRRG